MTFHTRTVNDKDGIVRTFISIDGEQTWMEAKRWEEIFPNWEKMFPEHTLVIKAPHVVKEDYKYSNNLPSPYDAGAHGPLRRK